MTVTTGMLMRGKMSMGMVTMDSTPMTAINRASTTNVYGRARASRTIHMIDGGVDHDACQERPPPNSFTEGTVAGPRPPAHGAVDVRDHASCLPRRRWPIGRARQRAALARSP